MDYNHFKYCHSNIVACTISVYEIYIYNNTSLLIKGVFKGGGVQGVQTPPQKKFFRFFLKSEGKEIERKKNVMVGGGGYLLTYFCG